MTSEHTLRARRVAQSIKKVVTDFLSREVADPTLSHVVVTDVELTADLGIATIKARLFTSGGDAEQRRNVMKSLSKIAGRLRKHLGRTLRLKRVPEVRFVYDVGADASLRVEELLADIAREKKSG